MATVEFRYDPKNTAWFTANAAMVLKAGEPAYHDTTGLFKLGDGVTALSALSFLPTVSASTPTIQQVLTAGQVATTTIETTGFIKTGGTSAQFLKADGSVDSNVYGVGNALTTNPLSQFAATTSSQLAGVISDETGTGALVFGTSPTFTTSIFSPLVNGASTASGTLTLASTTNATKGTIQIGTTDLVNIGNKTTTSQRLVRIGQDTAWVDIGSLVGSTAAWAIYGNQATPSVGVAALWGGSTTTNLNGPTTVNVTIQTSVGYTMNSFTENLFQQPNLRTSGAGTFMEIRAGANTNQTLGTNIPNFKITGANKQWATGALATQYFNYFTANTVSFVGASTATNVYNLFCESPIAGVNATITNNYAAGFSGNIHQLNNGTNGIKFQPLVGSTTYSAIYMNQATPSGNNYTLACGGTDTYIRGTSSLSLVTNQAIISISTTQVITTDSINYSFGTTSGTKLGVSTTQKLSFWNATPIVQPTTAVASATVVSGTGGNVKHDDTFDGYTVEKVVRALRTIGLLA
jgi:hypothetical protein